MSSPSAPDPPVDVLDTTAAGRAAIRGGTLRGAGYAAGLLLSAASVPFVFRHLGLADFGRFVLVTALMALVGGLTEVGLQAVGIREYSTRSGAARDRLMSNLLGVRITLTVLGVLGALVFVALAGYGRTLMLGTVLAGAALLLTSVQTLVAVPLVAHLRLGWATVAELLRQTLTVALTLALVVTGAELLPFFAVLVPGSVAGLALTAILVRRQMPFRPSFDAREWWLLVRESLVYAVAIAVNVAYFRIAIVIVSLLATELELGYFSASFRILEVLLPIPALAVGAVFPILARAARDDLHRLAYASQRVFDVAVIGGAAIVLVLEVGAPLIMQILTGESAEPAVSALRIQAPALLATFIAVACGFVLLSLRRHRDLLVANLAPLALSIGLTLALVPPLGADGAALATTAAEWSLALVSIVLLARAIDEFHLSLRIAGPVLVAGGAGAGALLIPAPVALQAVVAAALYLAVLLMLRSVPPELMDALARRRPA